MNSQNLFKKLATVVFSAGVILTVISPTLAQTSSNTSSGYLRFFCGNYQGQPATFIRTRQRGNLPWIYWNSSNSGTWPPERRCQEISGRFQRYYDNGTLKYITTGVINRQQVICVAAYRGGSCLPNGLILTLSPGGNSDDFLRNMMEFRVRVGGPVLESGPQSLEGSCISENNLRSFNINVLCLVDGLEESSYPFNKLEREDQILW